MTTSAYDPEHLARALGWVPPAEGEIGMQPWVSMLFRSVDEWGLPFADACSHMTEIFGGIDLGPFILLALGRGWSPRKIIADVRAAGSEGALPRECTRAAELLIMDLLP